MIQLVLRSLTQVPVLPRASSGAQPACRSVCDRGLAKVRAAIPSPSPATASTAPITTSATLAASPANPVHSATTPAINRQAAMAQATLNQLDCDIERLFEWLGDYEPDTPTPEVPS